MRSILVFVALAATAFAADCRTATVGSPHSNCWDIANAAGITTAQLSTYNPGLDCNVLQVGQRVCISTGTLPDLTPKPNPDGTCATHTVATGEWCALITARYGITLAQLATYNTNTWKWKGCESLAAGLTICVSSGRPPAIPVNPDLQCGPESPGNATCALKACCSPFGYCGLTSEFCNTAPNGDPCLQNCGQPTLKTCSGSQLKRKIGYYAGWAARRSCQSFSPKHLDLTGYTDVIFAFAEISQSMEISLSSQDVSVLRELVALKSKYPGLKVTIAVGGWTFSTAEPTKTIFTVMIATSTNRAKFINSVKSFLSTYSLDGVDIDMEYPSAMERGAPKTDTPNLTAFFKELKANMGSNIVSLAAPAGYWFLKGFEIDKIAQDVTYINMMSYDYHGAWDKDVAGEDGTAKPHTSIKDIEDSAKLFTRAGVDLGKVNLGLAWYGRTYNVGSCRGMGCPMITGGQAGQCSGESGIKSQLEIWNDAGSRTLDTSSQTYWYNKGNDFITYDDTETWAAKTTFAGNRCFGGTFVWSLDLVRPVEPPPPAPPIDVECASLPASKVLADCRVMIRDIFDTYNLNNTRCNGVIGVQAMCHNDCCLYITMNDWRNRELVAKEVKVAAQAILDQCFSPNARALDPNRKKRIIPALLAIVAAWNGVAITAMIGFFTTMFANILAAIFKNIFNDDEERRAFVIQTIGDARNRVPEFNFVMAHTKHVASFDQPYWHEHIEFDRPAPHGTFGYEVYYARTGKFELQGDGDYINWGWAGHITSDPDNSKKLTFYAPGISYGIAGPVRGSYTHQGTKYGIDLVLGLGDRSACATCFL